MERVEDKLESPGGILISSTSTDDIGVAVVLRGEDVCFGEGEGEEEDSSLEVLVLLLLLLLDEEEKKNLSDPCFCRV